MTLSDRRFLRRCASAFLAALALVACDDDPPPAPPPSPPSDLLYPDGCDPIVQLPAGCGFPFPSDVWTAADSRTATGLHLELAPGPYTSPIHDAVDTTPLRSRDGFSASGAITAYMPGASELGLPDSRHVEDSLSPDSPTVVIDAASGELVQHWAELDANDPDVISLRPVTRLRDATRYVVAIRGVRHRTTGEPIPPTPTFRGLRDGHALGDPRADVRRDTYSRILAVLDARGIDRAQLQLAWEFTTASEATNVRQLLRMRDEAWVEHDAGRVGFTIDEVDNDVDTHIARRIEGKVLVPSYVDAAGLLVVDSEGNPIRQGVVGAAFVLEIPYSAAERACPVLHYGDPGFQDVGTIAERLRAFADAACFATFGMAWAGFRPDDGDLFYRAASEDPMLLRRVTDLARQGTLDQLVGLRVVLRDLAEDPQTFLDHAPTIAAHGATFLGIGQGGILGATYLAVSPDVERAVLVGPSAPYSLMLPRSTTHRLFERYTDDGRHAPSRLPLLLGLMQILMDPIDPASYSHRILADRFPGTRPHELAIVSVIGDRAMPTIGAQWLARNVGLPNVTPAVRPVFGLREVASPRSGSGLVELQLGATPDTEPVGSRPSTAVPDPHVSLWTRDESVGIVQRFVRDGVIDRACGDGCDHAR